MNQEDIAFLVRARMAQAREALADSRALLEGGGSGRSVVNRSYYAMFYGVLALLQTIGQVPRKHQGAISLFDREFVHRGHFSTELSVNLHWLFEVRQEDDYQRLEPISLEEARRAFETAEGFVAAVDRHLSSVGFSTGA